MSLAFRWLVGFLLVFICTSAILLYRFQQIANEVLLEYHGTMTFLVTVEKEAQLLFQSLIIYDIAQETFLVVNLPQQAGVVGYQEGKATHLATIYHALKEEYLSWVETALGLPIDMHLQIHTNTFSSLFALLGGASFQLNKEVYRQVLQGDPREEAFFEEKQAFRHHFFSYSRFLEYLEAVHALPPSYEKEYQEYTLFRGIIEALLHNARYFYQPHYQRVFTETLQVEGVQQAAYFLRHLQSSAQTTRDPSVFSQYVPGILVEEEGGVFISDVRDLSILIEAALKTFQQEERYLRKPSYNVSILNGTNLSRLAERTAHYLQTIPGWEIVTIGNADRADYAHTLVLDYAAPSNKAQELAEVFACQRVLSRSVSPLLEEQDITLILGQDFHENRCYQ